MYHLLSGFSGPLRNRKPLSKDDVVNNSNNVSGEALTSFPTSKRSGSGNRGGGRGGRAGEGGGRGGRSFSVDPSFVSPTSSANGKRNIAHKMTYPTASRWESSWVGDVNAGGEAGEMGPKTHVINAAFRANKANLNSSERRHHSVIKSHFDIGPGSNDDY